MIQFNNVTKIYDKKIVAVSEVSFKIEEGEFVFLIGPSGSGKSTLIKLLVRDETPTSGSIFFSDINITRISRSKVYKLRREIGVIFQDFKLIQDKTAYENIAFAMEVAGKKNSEIKETVPYVLEIVGLQHRMNSYPRQLSGGEQQRVAIARAIANNPKLLIADEPTGNLDPGSAWDIIQILNKINQWGTTVIMSTHGTDIVNTLDKRVIQLDRGRVVRDDTKGKYEMVKKFEENMIETFVIDKDEQNTTSTRSNKIKLSFKNGEKIIQNINSLGESSQKINRNKESKRKTQKVQIDKKVLKNSDGEKIKKSIMKSLLSKIFFFAKKRYPTTNITSLEDVTAVTNLESESDEIKKTKTSNGKNAIEIESLEVSDRDQNYQVSKTPLKYLNLSSKIYKTLKKAGFKTIEDVIEVGPKGLENIVDLSPEQIIKIAKKITSYTYENSKR